MAIPTHPWQMTVLHDGVVQSFNNPGSLLVWIRMPKLAADLVEVIERASVRSLVVRIPNLTHKETSKVC